ncbi:hypothetical protein IP81_05705 [Novosphingobium sp. AAP83]|uniref:hypothetical protein n=1 Tax=Novosphingobium sp. AAP83 TaxID=1523425 RepID=UPI0006B8AB89|nr:hypothetical protein [Novosphingobium sp. AAP83]KPF92686.1 hypothetical protein IP81_05705 [Novosphingobium sp. AAP83]
MNDILQATQALRDQAWDALRSSPAFAQVCALDDAVVAMGGASILGLAAEKPSAAPSAGTFRPSSGNVTINAVYNKSAKRISHAAAAYRALTLAGRPMQSPELLNAARAQGADIGGTKPIINMTSSLSRSDEVYSLRIGGVPHWWIIGQPLPHDYALALEASPLEHGQSGIFDEQERSNDGTPIELAL